MKRNALEVAVLIASVAAIAVLVIVLVAEGLSESSPANPRIEVHPQQGRQGSSGWIIPATMSNDGDQPAEALVVEATASVEGVEESSELEIAFLPAGSSVDIAFAFSGQPEGEVSVRLVGFRVP